MWFNSCVFIISFFILASCTNTKSKLPDSVGNGSEILVICNDSLWHGMAGEMLKSVLELKMEGLEESEYTIVQSQDLQKPFQLRRNILMIDIDPLNKKSKIETLKDVWSRNQRVIKIKAGSDTAFINLFNKHNKAIRELFNQNERAWFSTQNALSRNSEIEKTLADMFGIDISISSDFKLAYKKKDFIGLTSSDSVLSLLIYSYTFTDTSQLNGRSVLAERQKHTIIVSPEIAVFPDSSSGCAGYNFFSQKFLFRGMYALETRGSVSTNGKKDDSSFLNYSVVDAPRHRIIVFDGSVSIPGKPKRNYMRQLEAIILEARIRSDY